MNPLRSRDGGVTLLEMLIVLMMISVLLGIGIGVFANLDKNLSGEITIERLKSMLRLARNTAIRNGSPAYVLLDAKKRSITGAGASVVGQWSLEDETGAIGGDLDIAGGDFSRDGRFGGCLDFGDGGGTVATRADPNFDPRGGFVVEAYIRPTVRRTMTVFEMEGSYRLILTDLGNLAGELDLASGTLVSAESDGFSVPLGRWSRVAIGFNGNDLSLSFDGVEVATEFAQGEVAYVGATPVSIGFADTPFTGAIDELRVFNLATRDTFSLPTDVNLRGKTRLVRFDRSGRLNPEFHSGPERVEIETLSRIYTIEVSLLGSVR